MKETQIPKGRYLHYKNDDSYEVIGEGKHTETHEHVVIYRALYETDEYDTSIFWVRSKKEFLETVEWQGKRVPRFRKMD